MNKRFICTCFGVVFALSLEQGGPILSKYFEHYHAHDPQPHTHTREAELMLRGVEVRGISDSTSAVSGRFNYYA